MSNDADMKETANAESSSSLSSSKSATSGPAATSAKPAAAASVEKENATSTSTCASTSDVTVTTVDTTATDRKDNDDTKADHDALTTPKSTTATTTTPSTEEIKQPEDGNGTTKKEEEEKKPKKVVDWPRTNIPEPHPHDVLYGRGGGTNHHPGNKRYRKMVEDRKLDYVNSKRLDKPLVALEIIRHWRSQDPPGRFLKVDEKTGLWNDVGDKKAREKTSQALREKAPQIRLQQQEELIAKEGGSDSDNDGKQKSTTFAEGTKTGGGHKPAAIARDTSLGREYINPDEGITIEQFSWHEGLGTDGGGGGSRQSSTSGAFPRAPSGGNGPAPGRGFPPMEGSYGMGPSHPPPPNGPGGPYRYDSRGNMGAPPPRYMSGEDDRHVRYTSQGRYESWGGLDTPLPPPQPGFLQSIRSHGSWGPPQSAREHSLGPVALPHASVSHPAPYDTFDSTRNPSGQYHQPYPPPPPPPQAGPHGPPPPGYGPPPSFHYSGGPHPPQQQQQPPPPPPPRGAPPPYSSGPQQPPAYAVDPTVASAWSGQGPGGVVRTLSGEEYDRQRNGPPPPSGSPRSPKAPSHSRPSRPLVGVKPDPVKRSTSNQNETLETRPDMVGPSIKKAALNRDNSLATNRLKEICFPDQFSNGKFDVKKEVQVLNQEMSKSSLGGAPAPGASSSSSPSMPPPSGAAQRSSTQESLPSINDNDVPCRPPSPIERTSTLDRIAATELSVKPEPLSEEARATTANTLDEFGQFDLYDDTLNLDDPLIDRPGPLERITTDDIVMADLMGGNTNSLAVSGAAAANGAASASGGPSRPSSLAATDRMTTTDILEIVNEPIVDDDEADFAVGNGRRQEVL